MPASATRERLVTAAHDLFYEHGFHAVGIDRITEQVGVTKTTFYNHFESKDELVLASLEWHDRWWRDEFRRMIRAHGGDAPRSQLDAIPDALEELFNIGCEDKSGCAFNGCIFVNVSVEFPSLNDPAHEAARCHKLAMLDVLREIAGYAGASDPRAFAEEMSLVMEGAYVTRQVTGDDKTAGIARRVCELVLSKHLPNDRDD